MKASVEAITTYLPESVLTNEELAAIFPEWSADKILSKTGILNRHIAAEDECASDLGVAAAEKLFAEHDIQPDDIDFVLFCSQSPDYALPTTACLIQDRLGIPTHAGALDFNLGCSGFLYGLSLAKGLVETGQSQNLLLITAETYSKYIQDNDKGTRSIFGDAAAATLITAVNADHAQIGPIIFGTDGSGGKNLIVKNSASRIVDGEDAMLFMDGPEIFTFTLKAVPAAVENLLQKAGLTIDDVDQFVFHQANKYMLKHLRRKCGIPKEKFYLNMQEVGNTVSPTIPIALRDLADQGKLKSGDRIMLVGFGVGYSWSAGLIQWQ